MLSLVVAAPHIVETIDDYDALLFAFVDASKPLLARVADAYYGGDELSRDEVRAFLLEVREIETRLRTGGVAAWPTDSPGPKVQPTTANIEHLVVTCRRVSALLECAIERDASIRLDGD